MPRDSVTIVAIDPSEQSIRVQFSDDSSAVFTAQELSRLKPVRNLLCEEQRLADPATAGAPPSVSSGDLHTQREAVALRTAVAPSRAHPPSGLIAGEGEMAERIRNHPWCDSPLGPIETWPATLLTHVNLVLHSPSALAIYWGPEMIFIGNDGSDRVIGPGRIDALGLPAHELWGDNWHQLEDHFHAVLSSGQPFSGENLPFRFPRNGRSDEVFLDFSLSPIYDEGVVVGIFRTLHETTETVLAMRALAESNERLHMALSVGTGFGVWDWHIQTGIVYADETIAKLYSLDPSAAATGVSHLLYQRMLHPDDIVVLTDAIMECIMTGSEYNVEYRVLRADSSYGWVQSMGRCLYDEEGHAYRVTGLKTDVTERKRCELPPPAKAPAALFSGEQWDLLPAAIRSFLSATFYFLTDHPEKVSLEVVTEGDESRIAVRAGADDLGKLIGKQGRTIRSVRTLLLAVNAGNSHRFTIDVESNRKAPGTQ